MSAQSTQRTTCWSCGESFFKVDRYCPACGKDSWNPPQGPAAVMARTTIGPQTYRTPTPATGSSAAPTYMADGRQTTIAAGVGILATLAAMSFWFWLGIGVIGAINEPDLAGSYVSPARALIALAVAVVGTVLTWKIASAVVEASGFG